MTLFYQSRIHVPAADFRSTTQQTNSSLVSAKEQN
jgi:hypothetical protein